jgi:Regulator of ribonuclease activity B
LTITRFYLYFADEHSARRSVDVLQQQGFQAETGLGWDDPFWVTIARRLLADDQIEQAAQQMLALARSLGGDYGGFDQRPPPPGVA